jgi:hypothetical protein
MGECSLMSDYVRAIERSIEKKITELEEMQKNNVKIQHQINLKEEISRLKRSLKRAKDEKR